MKPLTPGAAVRALRISQGMTQRQFARTVGLWGTFICEIETGYSEPSLEALRRIGGAFKHELVISFRPIAEPCQADSASPPAKQT